MITGTPPVPRYTGTAPYGSCYQQCVAGLLDWKGIPDAAEALGLTWGYSWSGGECLDGSGRWLAGAAAVHGVRVADRRFPDVEAALACERESISAGHPVAAAVDAYHLPSEYHHTRHITHCVLVVGADADGVTVVDPMNRPAPVRYRSADWVRMRAAPHAQDSRTFLVRSGPERTPGPAALARALGADLRDHAERDERTFAAYLDACADGTVAGAPDISGVAAERLYLGRMLGALSAKLPELVPVAQAVTGLERRWYLAHTLAIEPGGVSRDRHLRLIRGLGEREREQRHTTADIIAALPYDAEERK